MPDFVAEALTWEANRHYVAALKTARAWGVPPLSILTGSEQGWTQLNRLLATALTIMEEETCKNCNTPLWWAYSTDNRVQFNVSTTVCYGCAKLDETKNGVSKDGKAKKELKPGEMLYVKPYNVVAGEKLPSRHDSYTREARQ